MNIIPEPIAMAGLQTQFSKSIRQMVNSSMLRVVFPPEKSGSSPRPGGKLLPVPIVN